MKKGTQVLHPAKELLSEFAEGHSLVTNCSCTEGKVTGPGHQVHPNAMLTKKGEFNINVRPASVLVGIRVKGMAFSCTLETPEPNLVKEDLIEFLSYNAY